MNTKLISSAVIDGKAIAEGIKNALAREVSVMTENNSFPAPGLAVILVGDDESSVLYVKNKQKACEIVGIKSYVHRLPADTHEKDILFLIRQLNDDNAVNGILIQLPLPAHLSQSTIINAVTPAKDVDGLTYINAGHMLTGDKSGIAPCTPLGCMQLLKSVLPLSDYSGKKAVVVGRSNLVGKPMAQMLLALNCTVTQCHSKTVNLAEEIFNADVVVSAVGKPHHIKAAWLKKDAIVIDVGISSVTDPVTGKKHLCGDVEFDKALSIVRAITPVPGGVGPMTIVGLLRNTVNAYKKQNGIL